MTIDNTGGSYDGRIYIAWVDLSSWSSARLMFRYTTSLSPVSFGSELELEAKTGSFSEQSLLSHLFLSPIVTYDVLQAPTPVVAPNGDVYVSWIDIDE